MPRTWYIIRHADKEKGDFYNPLLHHQDQPISTTGRIQAEALCAYFTGKPIEQVYVSEYLRTSQTVEPTARQLGLTPQIDGRLNEFDTGRLERLTDLELQRDYPEIWSAILARSADFRFPGGETGVEAQSRIVDLLEETRRKPGDGDFLFMTHDGLIRLLMCYVAGIPVYKRGIFRVDTCGVMELIYQPEFAAWKLVRFNHTC